MESIDNVAYLKGLRSHRGSFFQRVMDRTFNNGIRFTFVVCYIDDILTYSKALSGHFDHLRQVLERLHHANLKIKLVKCYSAQREVKYLGHRVSGTGIRPY